MSEWKHLDNERDFDRVVSEKKAKEMYERLCLTGTDQDTALEKVLSRFETEVVFGALPWKRRKQ